MCCACCAQWLVRQLLRLVVVVFFREVDHFNLHKIPEKGPVIFVCAPHANQFVDPMLVVHNLKRPVGFLAAKKSCDRRWVGKLIRALNSIPVKRPQDYMSSCQGAVTGEGTRVQGHGTQFTKDLEGMSALYIKSTNETLEIENVVSDTEVIVRTPIEEPMVKPEPFKAQPKIDQSEVYKDVWHRLNQGECIGIFPEGGSHDRTSLLPLKAGVTLMALGAKANRPDLDVKIVPVGLYYFNAHLFRSSAYVDFGDAITVDPQLVEMYIQGKDAKRRACAQLLEEIQQGLQAVTINAPDFETLQLLRLSRRLYHPAGRKLTMKEKLELQRRFALAYGKFKDNPKVSAVMDELREYKIQLENHSLRDHQVMRTEVGGLRSLFLLLWRLFMFVVFASLAIPGLLVTAPQSWWANRVAQRKAAEAKAASRVKVKGNDVVATWKVIIGGMLHSIAWALYTAAAVALTLLLGHDLPLWAKIAIPVGTFFALPFVGYAGLRFLEVGVHIIQSLPPLFYSLFWCCESRQRAHTLREGRASLQASIRNLVEELGPQFFGGTENFRAQRLVHHGDADDTAILRQQQQQQQRKGDEEKQISDSPEASASPRLVSANELTDVDADIPMLEPVVVRPPTDDDEDNS